MRNKMILLAMVCVVGFMTAGCATRTHFGIHDKALMVPADFDQTEAAIARAEKSEGAKYCPDKIALAKEKGRYATQIYWTCRTDEAMALLAEARKLAKEAESCQPPVKAISQPAPPPPAAVPAPSSAKQPISFHSVYFDFDKSNLKAEARTELDRAAKIMQDNADVDLELQGNTDSVGSDAYNKALGDRRAKAVFDYLKSKGINSSRLKTVSLGEGNPAATNATDAGRAQNRRVVLVILK